MCSVAQAVLHGSPDAISRAGGVSLPGLSGDQLRLKLELFSIGELLLQPCVQGLVPGTGDVLQGTKAQPLQGDRGVAVPALGALQIPFLQSSEDVPGHPWVPRAALAGLSCLVLFTKNHRSELTEPRTALPILKTPERSGTSSRCNSACPSPAPPFTPAPMSREKSSVCSLLFCSTSRSTSQQSAARCWV